MAKRLLLVLLLVLSAAGLSYSADYLIGPGDVIEISVYDNDDLKTRVRVGDDGSIIMPLLGQIKVDDMTIPQLSAKITELLADG